MTVPAPDAPASSDPTALLRDRRYLFFLLLGVIVGVPIAAFSYFFMQTISLGGQFFYTDLPLHLGFHGEPPWWPVLPLTVCGVLVALVIRYLPGTGGHSPADGFHPAGATPTIELPGILLAALLTLCLGPVLGPEAPLIALGSGIGVLVLHFVKRDAPATASLVVGAAGSFAAISVILGSPITAAFLLMEASGLGGAMLSMMLVPGLLAAGIGSLIFVGLDSWTGFGTFTLSLSPIPHVAPPNGAEFLWAIGIGLASALLGAAIRRSAVVVRSVVAPRMILLMPVLGLAIAGLAIGFAEATGKPSNTVLFSGQFSLPSLLQHSASWTAGALVLLLVCKGLAYALSLSSFRGGPIFPALFVGAAGGLALSHGPGLPAISGAAMGMGAMAVAMLGLPLVSVLLPVLFLSADAAPLMPLVIVAVVVSYVASAHLAPRPAPAAAPTTPNEPTPEGAPAG
ncbi:MAG: chloride channel protein [Acidimicrobiales bacterium]|nr:chloride channel protein [Acidimicrobiales bacterium]